MEYLRVLRAVVATGDYPDGWRRWFVIMIPKKNKDPSVFANMRDVWLVPHGWKIVTGCFQPAAFWSGRAEWHLHRTMCSSGLPCAEQAAPVQLDRTTLRTSKYGRNLDRFFV